MDFILATQSVVHGPAAPVLSGHLKEVQNSQAHIRPTESESAF